MVGVLADDDDLDVPQIDGAQRRQRVPGRRVDLLCVSFRLHKRSERLVPVARRLRFECSGPARREGPLVGGRAQRRRPRTDADAPRPESSASSESIGCLEEHERAHAFRFSVREAGSYARALVNIPLTSTRAFALSFWSLVLFSSFSASVFYLGD